LVPLAESSGERSAGWLRFAWLSGRWLAGSSRWRSALGLAPQQVAQLLRA
jgi:hypothetical protein